MEFVNQKGDRKVTTIRQNRWKILGAPVSNIKLKVRQGKSEWFIEWTYISKNIITQKTC